jgi:hypothetical protein
VFTFVRESDWQVADRANERMRDEKGGDARPAGDPASTGTKHCECQVSAPKEAQAESSWHASFYAEGTVLSRQANAWDVANPHHSKAPNVAGNQLSTLRLKTDLREAKLLLSRNLHAIGSADRCPLSRASSVAPAQTS